MAEHRRPTQGGAELPLRRGTTDHQIDALVYDLYALTPDEIALVEGTP